MCKGVKYFSAIPNSTYDPPRKLQWYWTYLDLFVVLEHLGLLFSSVFQSGNYAVVLIRNVVASQRLRPNFQVYIHLG